MVDSAFYSSPLHSDELQLALLETKSSSPADYGDITHALLLSIDIIIDKNISRLL